MTVTDYRQCRWFLEGVKAAELERELSGSEHPVPCNPYLAGTPKFFLWHAGYSS